MVSLLLLLLSPVLTVVYAFDTECNPSCTSCTFPGDPYACNSCNDTTKYLILVENSFGYCDTPESCTAMGGLTVPSVRKCFIGGACQLGLYASDSVCSRCHSSCEECFGPGSNECLACNYDKMLYLENGEGGSCISKGTCTKTSYANGALCADNSGACATGCATCFSNSPFQCRSCNAGYQYLPENYIDTGTSWGTCGSTITIKRKRYNFGFNPSDSMIQFKCHWTCQSCVTETERLACTSCTNSAYLNVITEVGGVPVGNCKPSCSDRDERVLVLGNRKYCSSLSM